MDIAPSPTERSIAGMVRDFTRRELIPLELEVDERAELSNDDFWRLRRKAAELGLLGVDFPVAYGGAGLGAFALTVVREELGATSYALQFTATAGPLKLLMAGTEEQRQKYIVPVLRGEQICAFAVTEPAAGSDPSGMETTARRDGDSWILNGMKHFISQGSIADFVVVFALTDREKRARGGISAFVVEKGTPGFRTGSIHRLLGWRGVPQAELIFDNCRIPAENLLGEEGSGFKNVMGFLDQGRLNVAATAIGKAQRCLDLAIAYAKERRTFGAALAERQAIQWMIADSTVDLHAARLMLREAARRMDHGERVTTEAAMSKLFATEMAEKVVDRAIQIHGGVGVSRDLPLELHYRDLRLLRIAEGPSEIQRMIIARAALA